MLYTKNVCKLKIMYEKLYQITIIEVIVIKNAFILENNIRIIKLEKKLLYAKYIYTRK